MKMFFSLILLLVMGTVNAAAKSAEDFFHNGAAMYIEGRMQQATIEVEEGLRQFPEDPKLNALGDQLKKLEEQQKQDNQNQSGEGQQNDQENKEKDQDQNTEAENQQEDEQEKADDKQEEQENTGGEEDDKEPPKDSLGQGEAPPEQGEMSEEEAKRLLDNYKNDEKQELKNLKKKVGRRGKPVKDW